MNNKNRLFRVTSLLLVLCFISTAMISGTFAKYTSEYAGQDTALIAKWSVGFSDGAGGIIGDETAALDLFSHAYDTSIVQSFGGDYIIAPGVEGDFTLDVQNLGDVAAAIEFEFEVAATSVKAPILYSLDNDFTDTDNVYFDKLGAAISTSLGNEFDNVMETNGTDTITVYWRWPHDVAVHNTLTTATTGVAADRTDAGLTGSGALIEFPVGTPTAFKAWTDDDDTDLGEASTTKYNTVETAGQRTTYILNVTATATQIAPTE